MWNDLGLGKYIINIIRVYDSNSMRIYYEFWELGKDIFILILG